MSFFVYNDRDFSSNFPFQLNALLDFLLDCFFFTVIDEGRFCRFMELAISWSRFGGFPISLLSSPAVHGLAFFFLCDLPLPNMKENDIPSVEICCSLIVTYFLPNICCYHFGRYTTSCRYCLIAQPSLAFEKILFL